MALYLAKASLYDKDGEYVKTSKKEYEITGDMCDDISTVTMIVFDELMNELEDDGWDIGAIEDKRELGCMMFAGRRPGNKLYAMELTVTNLDRKVH